MSPLNTGIRRWALGLKKAQPTQVLNHNVIHMVTGYWDLRSVLLKLLP